MSYFLFGAVRLGDLADGERDDFAWQIVMAGAEARLFVLVGPNVTQAPVRDILRQRDLLGGEVVTFMITASPLRDTSHELISPYRMTVSDLRVLCDSLDRVRVWIERVSGLQCVQGIQVFTCEGYDTSFAESESSPADFIDLIIKGLETEGNVPSLRVHIRLPGGAITRVARNDAV